MHSVELDHRSCLGLLYLERRGSVFYRLDSLFGGLLVATLGGLVQYSRDHGWEWLGSRNTTLRMRIRMRRMMMMNKQKKTKKKKKKKLKKLKKKKKKTKKKKKRTTNINAE